MENKELSKVDSFTKLVTWQEGHRLVLQIYKLVKKFPHDEHFGLTDQMRRAVVSITSNIAEGFSRGTYKEKSRFYYIALGSLTEIQNQLIIAKDVGYVSEADFIKISDQINLVSKLLRGLIKKTFSFISSR
jgi:four helix bundle protein